MVTETKVPQKFDLDPQGEFQKILKQAKKKTADLTVPLTLIAQSWFKTNRAIFKLRGPGKYEKLSPKYKTRKEQTLGFAYPALEGKNNRIHDAITNPTDKHAVQVIDNKKELYLGAKKTSDFPYAAIHQFGGTIKTKNATIEMPARPYLFVGGEQSAPSALNNRIKAWYKIIKNHILVNAPNKKKKK